MLGLIDNARVYNEAITFGGNTPPGVTVSGGGTYPEFTNITLGGTVTDDEGDLLTYQWLNNGNVLEEGQIQAPSGGDPISLTDFIVNTLPLGSHTLVLSVNDGNNDAVTADVGVEIVDETAPTLAPTINQLILWPPNHDLVDMAINANAADNSGFVTLSAAITSNEPIDGTGDGDTSPDWTVPDIDHDNGIISFQLRSERAGCGEGRIYTIVVTATDDSGNSSSAEVQVKVPHNKGKKKGKKK